MKLTNKLQQKFNTPDTHLVVSGWPDTKSKTGYHGDSAFTREVLRELVRKQNMRFVVIADKNGWSDTPRLEENGNILILPVITHKFHVYPIILKWLSQFPFIKDVTVHSNFTFSGIRHFMLLIPFLLLIRSTGRRVNLFAHNVLEKVDFISKQLNVNNRFVISFLNSGIRFYNGLLGRVCDRIVVLDMQGMHVLSRYVPVNKLLYYPHFVKKRVTHLTKKQAKEKLGISPARPVILSFGFLSYYKGSDKLAELFTMVTKGERKNPVLIFAGGPSASMNDKPHYQRYLEKFYSLCGKNKNIRVTGFLPEKKLATYFAVADLVVLPYRGLMGGSGALGYAIGYSKPFMISNPMKEFWGNPDVESTLKSMGVASPLFTFPLTEKGIKAVMTASIDVDFLAKGKEIASQLRNKRALPVVTDKLYNELYARPATKFSPAPILRHAWKTVTALF